MREVKIGVVVLRFSCFLFLVMMIALLFAALMYFSTELLPLTMNEQLKFVKKEERGREVLVEDATRIGCDGGVRFSCDFSHVDDEKAKRAFQCSSVACGGARHNAINGMRLGLIRGAFGAVWLLG
jgi:hypothetical protein